MKLRYLSAIVIAFVILITVLTGCGNDEFDQDRPFVVTTTMMLEDAVINIAGDFVRVHGIMGPGVDPHVYRATPADFRRLEQADLIIYNGHFLEARLSEILARMPDRTHAATEVLDETRLIEAYEYGGNFDPHVWFDVALWAEVVKGIGERLGELLPDEARSISENTEQYIQELYLLHDWVAHRIDEIPEQRRLLITAHDAFGYFGKAYNIRVEGLQGLSTQSEYGLQDVSGMVRLIMDRQVPAIFLETSIAPRSVQSLINGVKERGGEVRLGGELFSDAMGERGTEEGTYIGMVRHNVNTIVEALK